MTKPKTLPPQHQNIQPGLEKNMSPQPEADNVNYQGSNKLKGKAAIITGGDSGIGRAIAIAYAKEGADFTICYLNEHDDANETKKLAEEYGAKVLTIAADITEQATCENVINQHISHFGHLDILINNAAMQFPHQDFLHITKEQLIKTFSVNVFAMFYLSQFAIPHLRKGSSIINTTSVTAYRGSKQLVDYASTKGAIVAYTRSLSLALVDQGIRVNAVAPGPIWTPLIPASFDEDKVSSFGQSVPMKRPGQPDEVAPCFVFLASSDASYMTGQVLHPNGGEIING
jgi:NAD(P)-dependent dehydrogenase (short-subunit alcohol dehydrogenase family)